MVLVGIIQDHPRQEEFKAELQITSPIVEFNLRDRIARTENTEYALEEQAPSIVICKSDECTSITTHESGLCFRHKHLH